MARHLITSALPYINGDQAPGQPGRVDAPGGRLRPLPAPARPRGALHLRHRRARHPGRAGRQGGRAAGRRVLRPAARRPEGDLRRLRAVLRLLRPQLLAAEPRDHPALRRASCSENGFIEERAIRQVYSLDDERFLPDRYIVGTCPHCGYDKARGDQCENCTRVLDPTDLIDPRSAICGSTRAGGPRDQAPLPAASRSWPTRSRRGSTSTARTGRCSPPRSPASGSTRACSDRGITRDLDWGVPGPGRHLAGAGRRGQGLLRLVRRPDRVHRRDQGVGRRRPRRDARLEVAGGTRPTTTSATPSSWRKDNVPFHTVMFPATLLGTRRAVEEGRLRQGLQLADLLRRQVLHLPAPRRLHRRRAGAAAGRLLALLPDGQRARSPTTPASPGSCSPPRSTRTSPTPSATSSTGCCPSPASASATRSRPARRPGEAEQQLGEQIAGLLAEYEDHMEALQFRKAAAGAAGAVERGQRLPGGEGPLAGDQDRPGRRRAHAAHRDEPDPPVRGGLRAVHPGLRRAPCGPAFALAGRHGGLGHRRSRPARWTSVPAGHGFTVPPVLFAKITDEDLDAYRERFGGTPETAA